MENKELELLTWNTNFCWKKENRDWKEFTCNLMQENFDFILLQEINPFFVYNINYEVKNGPLHFFKKGNKNIYYHELSDVLLKERPHDAFWGTAIITNEQITKVKTHFYNDKNQYTGSNYFGHEALMCYDFYIENGGIITLMNYYKKSDTCKAKYNNEGKCINLDEIYCYDNNFFSDIELMANNKNMTLFTGDFNITKREAYAYDKGGIIKKIENIGFINKTNNVGRTMDFDNQNDYIFVNSAYSSSIYDVQKISPPCFFDHYGIKCKIKL